MAVHTKKMLYILHLYYEESHYFNDPQLWNIKKTTEQKFVFWQNDGRNAGKKR